MVGGSTCEEARCVAEVNAAGARGEGWSAGTRVLLGGTHLHNSASFLRDFQELLATERYQS